MRGASFLPEKPKGDIVSLLPEELLLHATSFLDAASLLRAKTLNKRLYELCAKDDAGWKNLCQELWKDKICVAPEFSTMPSMTAYRRSLYDSQTRQHVRDNEFVYNVDTGTGPIWSFRFKEASGPDWTSWDPWWNGREARKMVFISDGTIQQYIPKGSEYHKDLLLRNPQVYDRELESGRAMLLEPPVSMTWRFCERPMDLPVRERGSYIRLAVGGRDVPTYVVRRSPTGNWGFLAESCWGVYTSFELPARQEQLHFMDDRVADEATRNYRLLADDSKFIISNQVQWREALLYNFGATVLPEGDSATEDFDRMFGQTLRHRPSEEPAMTAPGTEGVGFPQAASLGGEQQDQQQPQQGLMEE